MEIKDYKRAKEIHDQIEMLEEKIGINTGTFSEQILIKLDGNIPDIGEIALNMINEEMRRRKLKLEIMLDEI